MNEVIKFLQENPVQYLATVGRDGKPSAALSCSPVSWTGNLWFCTNNQKEVYKDMQANPNIEVSVSSPAYAWIRLNGKAVFENNMAAKGMCIQNPIVKGQYGEATNPIFEVFYLKDAHGGHRRLLRQPARGVRSLSTMHKQLRRYPAELFLFWEGFLCRQKVTCNMKCIDLSAKSVIIQQEHCLHCWELLWDLAPARAIERR